MPFSLKIFQGKGSQVYFRTWGGLPVREHNYPEPSACEVGWPVPFLATFFSPLLPACTHSLLGSERELSEREFSEREFSEREFSEGEFSEREFSEREFSEREFSEREFSEREFSQDIESVSNRRPST